MSKKDDDTNDVSTKAEAEVEEEDVMKDPTDSIPKFDFVEDVASYVAEYEGDVTSCLTYMNGRMQQYKRHERMELGRIQHLKQQVPELDKSITALRHLIAKRDAGEDTRTQFDLYHGVYANAVLRQPKEVYLWIGANVMVEFPLEDAMQLLESNRAETESALGICRRIVDFLRDQVTTIEVSMARVVNYDLSQRRSKQKSGSVSQ